MQSKAVSDVPSEENTEIAAPPPRLDRNFYLLISGSFISMMGGQFTLIALPWLVLKLTGDAVALGAVLAVMAVPRAALMLLGGAVVDRLSPLRVLIGSKSANAIVIAILAGLVWSGGIQLWMLYLIALGIGTATAFAYPAGSAILPQIVAPEKLTTANSLTMGLRQLSMFVGPALAGVVVAMLTGQSGSAAGANAVPAATGIAVAFTIDAVSFLASIVSLIFIRVDAFKAQSGERSLVSVARSIGEGVRSVWRDFPLRAFMLYVGAVSIFVVGPLQVGLPVLANNRMDWGAAAYGALMAASGAGTLLGTLLAAVGARLIKRRLGMAVLVQDSFAGLILIALGFVHMTLAGAALLLVSGITGGFIQVSIFTWMQQRVAPEMMGRTMSLLMFTFMGLAPLSAALGGFVLAQVGVTAFFAGAGVLLSVIALLSLLSPAIRSISAG